MKSVIKSFLLLLQAISAMSSAVRVSDLVAPYESREKSGDFLEWCERLELVASLQDIADKQKFLPLFLRGPAFAVFKELSEEDKETFKNVKENLAAAFGLNPVAAFQQFRNRVLGPGESVDAFAADLRRLLVATGVGEISEALIRAAVISGLPGGCQEQIMMLPSLEKTPLGEAW